MTRAPPASYSAASSAGSAISASVALGRAGALDLGDHRDARRAQRGEASSGGRAPRGRLELVEGHSGLAGGEVSADPGDDLVEDVHDVSPQRTDAPDAVLHGRRLETDASGMVS